MYVIALSLVSCALFNTVADKGAAPSKQGGQPGEVKDGNQTAGAAEQTATDAGDGGDTVLYVLNATGALDICWVYADSCQGAQSDNLLGDSMFLPPDYYLAVTGLAAECYDLWAFDCEDGAAWNYQDTLDGEFTWVLTGGGGGCNDSGCSDTGGGGWDSGW